MTFRLVATDLDGTLLPSTSGVPERTLDVLRRVREAGIPIVPVTARGPWSTKPVTDEFGLGGTAVCTSGAVLYDLDAERTLEQRMLEPGAAMRAVLAIRDSWPGVIFGCSRDGVFDHEPGYQPSIPPPEGSLIADALELVTRAMHKLIAIHPVLHADELVPAVRAALGAGYHVTSSGGRWVEILAPNAGKARMLADLCAARGITASEVIAFGDLPIDLEMLHWAGLGVATENAHPDVRAAADEVTASNDDEGVAVVLERLLSDAAFAP